LKVKVLQDKQVALDLVVQVVQVVLVDLETPDSQENLVATEVVVVEAVEQQIYFYQDLQDQGK
jgi:hypothetical protein